MFHAHVRCDAKCSTFISWLIIIITIIISIIIIIVTVVVIIIITTITIIIIIIPVQIAPLCAFSIPKATRDPVKVIPVASPLAVFLGVLNHGTIWEDYLREDDRFGKIDR